MLNSNSSAETTADSSKQPIVNSSADIEANPMLAAVPFSEWYANKLKVVGYPVLTEVTAEKGKYKDFDVFINVSDEYWMDYVNEFWKNGKQNHWFPMGEMHNDIGLPSIFGALCVMYQATERNLSVLLHCHAGINRSQTVKACFHYLMTGEHLPIEKKGRFIKADNMLQYNCEQKHLPELSKMELWLKACKKAFDNPEKFLGGMYDWTLRRASLV
jgi:protein-tyrosine phosphatase